VCDVHHIVYSQYFILVIAKRFILYYPVWAAIFRKNTLVDSTYKRAPALKPYGLRLPFGRVQILPTRIPSGYCAPFGPCCESYRVGIVALLRGMADLLPRSPAYLLKLSRPILSSRPNSTPPTKCTDTTDTDTYRSSTITNTNTNTTDTTGATIAASTFQAHSLDNKYRTPRIIVARIRSKA
jgi:hypothetical protein